MQITLSCLLSLPPSCYGQTDASGESIVYVSEPQPVANHAEEVIDMVENPVTSDAQVMSTIISWLHVVLAG